MFEQRSEWMGIKLLQKSEMMVTMIIWMDEETTELSNLVIPEWTFPHHSQVFAFQDEGMEPEWDSKIEMTTTFKTMMVEVRLAR